MDFVRDKHVRSEGHDYSHVLEVTELAIEIAKRIPERVDPFVLICGSLLHDIGRVNKKSGSFHGLEGAAIAEEYLQAWRVNPLTINKVARVIARHTPTTKIPRDTIEEKIVHDADVLDRFGWVGVLRGLLGKKGSIEDIFNHVIKKRGEDYDKLIFDVSRELGKKKQEETVRIIMELQKALRERHKEISEIEFFGL
ncbi:MAG: HD domain-containing protein [Candidatus Hydrothermarchaeales archaeon]